ncbi:hypothetical protein GpartN1_g6677.t1 [Galdieria partita]|uniref:Probable ATP-dependent transporter ycf16 n=1 Tax=Galdieria partita TaxID=83374 RepID=A0A9C7Q297_9RHOD|nr:hypothetical protein GpartN1_g6677.t1 [Galdieria partita]
MKVETSYEHGGGERGGYTEPSSGMNGNTSNGLDATGLALQNGVNGHSKPSEEGSSGSEDSPKKPDFFSRNKLSEEEIKNKLVEDGTLSKNGRLKLFGKIPYRKPTQFELRKLEVEERLGKWYEIPRYNVDSPEFDNEAYNKLVDEIYEEFGQHSGRVGVSFQDLTVKVPVYTEPPIKTVYTATKGLLMKPFKAAFGFCNPLKGCKPDKGDTHAILSNVSGYVLPGEMLLVLGPPGCGMSTLLNVLANNPDSDFEIEGQVLYGGKEADSSLQHFVRLVGQEDYHIASLSVRDTLTFAAECCIPDFIPFADRLRKDRLKLVAKGLGLDHVLGTPLGNNKIRGVSGGEKKRVTIGEMTIGKRAQLNLLDGFTRGLDAAVSLDIVRSMRNMADLDQQVFICAMQQPSEEIYRLFDKVLLLDQGKCLFFGKTEDAVPYFRSIGYLKPERRMTPEFLVSVSDPRTHKSALMEGWEHKAPTKVDEFEKCFRESSYFGKVVRGFREEEHSKMIPPKESTPSDIEHYYHRHALQPLPRQTQLLFKRQFLMEIKNKPALLTRFIRYVIMSLIMGALFWQTSTDEAGAGVFPGILFISMITIGLGSMSTLPGIYETRQVFYKQKDANFFDPPPYILAQTVVDFPLTFLESLIYSAILYFMAGLNSADGGRKFGFFLFAMWIIDMAMSTMIRMIGVGTRSFHEATAVAPAIIILNVVFAGFIIPRNDIPGWWIWLYWLSAFNYTLDAVMINQYNGLKLYCLSSEFVPKLPTPYESYETCPVSTGVAYLSERYGIFTAVYWKWLDIVIVAGFYLFFLSLSALALMFIRFSSKAFIRPEGSSPLEEERLEHSLRVSQISLPRLDSNNDVPMPSEENDEQVVVNRRTEDAVNMSILNNEVGNVDEGGIMDRQSTESNRADSSVAMRSFAAHDIGFRPVYMTWTNLSYFVKVSRKYAKEKTGQDTNELQLLHDVNGYAVPGRMIALVGASGAGKTTLLDVLAQRKTQGRILGQILLNKKPIDRFYRRIAGYVEQFDIHNEYATVREALEFSALLRQPHEVTREEKLLAVDRVLDILQLREVEHRLVGSATSTDAGGISAEARKRLTIGVELVSRSSVLFLDEPTSGLDARAALVVMKTVRRVVDTGRTVICTIHQPSTEIFEMFDDLLLLQKGGYTAYFGPLGHHSQTMIDYFTRKGASPPKHEENPADWVLETIGAGIGRGGPKDWSSVWRSSYENRKLLAQLEIQPEEDNDDEYNKDNTEQVDWSHIQSVVPSDAEPIEFDRYMASTWTDQLYQVVKRAFIVYWRMPSYNFVRIVMAIFMSLIIGSAFYKEPADQKGAEVGVAAIFMGAMYGILQLTSAIHPIEDERDVFYREISSGTYRPWVYWIAVTLDEIPYALFSGTIFTVFFYFLVGFPGSRFGQFYLAFVFFMLTAISIGQCIAILAPNQQVSQMVAPVINSLMFVLAGFIIPKPSIPNYMIWLYWANPYSYALEALAVDILHDKNYYCTPSEYSAFPKPPGVSCTSLGYSPAPSGTTCTARNGTTFDTCCLFCQITSGNDIMSEYGLSYHMLWIDIGALAAYVIGFRLLALIGIQYVHYINR